jgi:hypothetical protein
LLSWRFPIIGTVAATVLLLLLFLFAGDPDLSFLFLVIPCVALLILALLALLIFGHRRRRSLELLLATLVFGLTLVMGLHFRNMLRPKVRWAFFSQKFKRQVLGEPGYPSGDFKHVEWDGFGGAPVGDWTSYVVFDPVDSLNAETNHENPGKIQGIPCDVLRIQKLEPHWYSVTLQVNEWWERCRNDANAETPN